MKDRFIRVISPPALIAVLVLDGAVIWFAYFSVKKLTENVSAYSVIFAAVELFAIVVGVLVSREIIAQGVKFDSEKMVFTAIDDDNTYRYDEIESVETEKDTKLSFKKNFYDRRSHITLYLTDDRVATIDIGFTTKKTLKKIENEINARTAALPRAESETDNSEPTDNKNCEN